MYMHIYMMRILTFLEIEVYVSFKMSYNKKMLFGSNNFSYTDFILLSICAYYWRIMFEIHIIPLFRENIIHHVSFHLCNLFVLRNKNFLRCRLQICAGSLLDDLMNKFLSWFVLKGYHKSLYLKSKWKIN